jgi:hypothetical protein
MTATNAPPGRSQSPLQHPSKVRPRHRRQRLRNQHLSRPHPTRAGAGEDGQPLHHTRRGAPASRRARRRACRLRRTRRPSLRPSTRRVAAATPPAAVAPASSPSPAQPAATVTPSRATSSAVQKVSAFHSTRTKNGIARLRVATEAKSAYTAFTITLNAKGARPVTLFAPVRSPGPIQTISWHRPMKSGFDPTSFCVVGRTASGASSAKACSTVSLVTARSKH